MPRVGLTSPDIKTGWKGPTFCSVLSEKTRAISGNVLPRETSAVTDRSGFELATTVSIVELDTTSHGARPLNVSKTM